MNAVPDDKVREEESACVAQALRKQARLNVTSVWDLVNTRAPYPEAIPVLLEWLPRVRHPRIKEGIVRALTVKEARGVAGKLLIDEFKRVEAPPQQPRFEHLRDQRSLVKGAYTRGEISRAVVAFEMGDRECTWVHR